MKPFIRYIKSLWFPVIIVSILSLLTVAGTLYINLNGHNHQRWRRYSRRIS